MPSLLRSGLLSTSPISTTPTPPINDDSKTTRSLVKKTGLTTLCTPQQDTTTADVIFVHGLQGDPQNTWWHKPGREPAKRGLFHGLGKKKAKSGKSRLAETMFWPADLLPKDHNDIRIHTFGYDSRVTKGFAEPTSKSSIFEHGCSLLRAIARSRSTVVPIQNPSSERRLERFNYRGRPIIFVAHSLGGLVVKQALIKARKQENHDAGLFDVYVSAYAVIFFGTPHRGADLAYWGSMLSRIAEVTLVDTYQRILRELMPSGSTKLLELRLDFNDVLEDTEKRLRPLKVFTFQEELGMATVKSFENKVVPDFYSSFDSREYGNDYIHANHMDMCRFTDRNDDGYEKFQIKLGEYLEELRAIGREAAERAAAEEHARRQGYLPYKLLRPDHNITKISSINNDPPEILQRLDFVRRNSKRHHIQRFEVPKKTVAWIWSIRTGPKSFSQWLTSTENNIYWVSGKPGSGKSTLMDYLVRHPRTMSKLKQGSTHPWTIVDFFSDFRSTSAIANNLEGLLRSLLLQLAQAVPELTSKKFRASKHSIQVNLEDENTWTENRLRELIRLALQTSSVHVCIFVYGLDEYEGSLPCMIRFFQELAKLQNVKLCLASRPEPVLRQAFAGLPGLSLQEHNENAIRSYATEAIYSTFPSTKNDALLLNLSATVAKRAEGVFLWARFAIEEVLLRYTERDSEDELFERLEKIPSELEQIYTRILGRLEASGSRESHLMLLIACYAERPMSFQEFLVAVDLAAGRDIGVPVSIGDELAQGFYLRLQAKTGGLLEASKLDIDPASGRGRETDSEEDDNGVVSSSEDEKKSSSRHDNLLPKRKLTLHLSDQDDIGKIESMSRFRRRPMFHKWSSIRSLSVNDKLDPQLEKKSPFVVKLVHETVRTYLCHGIPLVASGGDLRPHALLLTICARYLNTITRSMVYKTAFDQSSGYWEMEGQEYGPHWPITFHRVPFLNYSATHVFDHARRLELSGVSSYPYFRSLFSQALFNVHGYVINADTPQPAGCLYCMEHVLSPFMLNNSTHEAAAARHGLLLYCKDAVVAGTNFEDKGEEILSSALSLTIVDGYTHPFSEDDGKSFNDVVRFVLDHGAQVQQTHLVKAFMETAPSTLKILLSHDSARRCKLRAENGEPVSLLWIFAKYIDLLVRNKPPDETQTKMRRGYIQALIYPPELYSYDTKLKILLEHVDNINEDCGPRGTVLQTLIHDFFSDHVEGRVSSLLNFFEERCECLLRYGANVQIRNGHHTPIAMLQEGINHPHFSESGRHITQRLLERCTR